MNPEVKKQKIGCDLDGVIAINHLNKADYRPYRLHEYYSKAVPTQYILIPFDVIITGRRIHYMKLTFEWLSHHRVEFKCLEMFPNKIKKSNESLAQYKEKTIIDYGITEYYEDDERIANYLKRTCPQTKIIHVTNAKPIEEFTIPGEIEF